LPHTNTKFESPEIQLGPPATIEKNRSGQFNKTEISWNATEKRLRTGAANESQLNCCVLHFRLRFAFFDPHFNVQPLRFASRKEFGSQLLKTRVLAPILQLFPPCSLTLVIEQNSERQGQIVNVF
jgi:hypothetical protein